MIEKREDYPLHDSIRGWFGRELYFQMAKDKRIRLIVGDLGYKLFDQHRQDYPDRFLNTGAAEMSMMGIAVGMAQEGLKPFVYSITTFLLYRPFETIRNYVDHERAPVRLVGSGRDDSYKHDGFSHHCYDAPKVLELFPNIESLWPDTKEQIPDLVKQMVETDKPYFISLPR